VPTATDAAGKQIPMYQATFFAGLLTYSCQTFLLNCVCTGTYQEVKPLSIRSIKTALSIVKKQKSMQATQKKKPTGLTKDAGWQFGVRKTFHRSREDVWDFLFSDTGLGIWLGKLDADLDINKVYRTEEGIEGHVNIFHPYSHIRLTWQPRNREHATHLQLRVMGDKEKTVISFHHDHLESEKERDAVKAYWNDKMKQLAEALLSHSFPARAATGKAATATVGFDKAG